jgi:hypothetical protein
MKHPKWLLIIVLVLLVINIVFYTLWFALDAKGKIRKELEIFLSKITNGTLLIEKLSINERLITASNVTFVDETTDLRASIKQIQVRYNLLRIISSGFSINNVIKEVVIFEPNVYVKYHLKPKAQDKDKKTTEIPDMKPYFDKISLRKGKLHIIFTADISDSITVMAEEELRDIALTVSNKNTTEAVLSAITENNGVIKASAFLDKGIITFIESRIDNYRPLKAEVTGFENLSTELTAKATYQQSDKESEPEFEISTVLKNTKIGYDKYNVLIPYLQVNGNQTLMQYSLHESRINNHVFKASGFVKDFQEELFINSSLSFINIDLGDFTDVLKGNATGNLSVDGILANLSAEGGFSIPELEVAGEKISNLAFEFNLTGKKAYLGTNSFGWRNQISEISGSFDIDKLSSDISLLTRVKEENPDFNLNADIDAHVDLSKGRVASEVLVNNLSFHNKDYSLRDFSGFVKADNATGFNQNFDVDLMLENQHGIRIAASGNLEEPGILASLELQNVSLEDHLKELDKQNIPLDISGIINATMSGTLVMGNMYLSVDVKPPHSTKADIISDFTFVTNSLNGNLMLRTENATAKDIPFELTIDAALEDFYVILNDLRLDDILLAQGKMNLRDFLDTRLWIKADDIQVNRYWDMIFYDSPAPFLANLDLELNYTPKEEKQVEGFLRVDSFEVDRVKPVNAFLDFSGNAENIDINGSFGTNGQNQVLVESEVALNPDLKIDINGLFSDLNLQDIVIDIPIAGNLNGEVNWQMTGKSGDFDQALSCNVSGSGLLIADMPIDSIRVTASQTNTVLHVEQLSVYSPSLMNIRGSGAIDYNFLTNNYTRGNNELNLDLDGDVLRLLRTYVPYFENARGQLNSRLTFIADENGVGISRGNLSMSNGLLRMKDQVNPIENIDLQASITDNVLHIDNFSCRMGLGNLHIRNEIDTGDDNFFVGPLNLGYFLIRTDNQGVQVSIPGYLPPNTFVNAVLSGQNSREATIKGPFDDMEIIGEVVASNGSAVYPANTKNILQMVNVFQRKPPVKEDLPLPFTLDLLVRLENNINYVTYPAHLLIMPGSFLRLTYDGIEWNAQEADFMSESGSLDFYGTIFEVEFFKVDINARRNILAVNGTFIKKADDGTLVTLTVVTNPQKGDDLISQLEFILSSDNPRDISATQILSRLRYSRSADDLSPDQRQNLLQDEAMQLISTSVSTTYVSQFLTPIENRIRRFLKLDSFSISTGFVQNLFVEFTSRDETNAAFSDAGNLNADIMQFSSAVFLNNLSLSMGKYLGRKVFLDYEIQLQETTDLDKKTKLDLYHNASIRYNLPWKLRFSYTFSIRPSREANSHEIMLQRSFRF